jgi:hypothetical protein
VVHLTSSDKELDNEKHLTTWDSVTNNRISVTTLSCGVQDMTWTKLNANTVLVVLCTNGFQCVLPGLRSAIGEPVQDLGQQVHDAQGTRVCFGAVSCASSYVASTLGQDVVIRNLGGSGAHACPSHT